MLMFLHVDIISCVLLTRAQPKHIFNHFINYKTYTLGWRLCEGVGEFLAGVVSVHRTHMHVTRCSFYYSSVCIHPLVAKLTA